MVNKLSVLSQENDLTKLNKLSRQMDWYLWQKAIRNDVILNAENIFVLYDEPY